MMFVARLNLAWKALQELGPGQVLHYAWYQILLHIGYLHWVTRTPSKSIYPSSAKFRHRSFVLRPLLTIPPKNTLRQTLGEAGISQLMIEADEILAGKVRLFGGEPVDLRLSAGGLLDHWTEYEKGGLDTGSGEGQDIKIIWEPGRFGWAYTLGRAYLVSGDERYAHALWEDAIAFLDANLPYQGPQWVSAQEVALRLFALAFASQVFYTSEPSKAENQARLSDEIAIHARRLLPSMAYARAQNNNHLLSEAAGLYTAGVAMPDHPEAKRWRDWGWRWFHWGVQRQISQDGTYVQHSTNYHRLMLQLALWVYSLSTKHGEMFPTASIERLAAATRWLLALTDAQTGGVPNLGPNDGAYLFPFTICPFQDYRPVLQAAGLAFLGQRPFSAGPWDEMCLWLGNEGSGVKGVREGGDDDIKTTPAPSSAPILPPSAVPRSPHVLRITHHESWAYLRVARFHSRPGHADQLHLDLWWRGLNLAQDAGAYLYNAPPPWDNSLARTCAHNTLAIDGRDQMTRAGRFLWLDWAQAEVIAHERADDGAWERLSALHDGYRRLGLLHQRTVTAFLEGRWLVEDQVAKVGRLKVDSASVDPTLHIKSSTFNLHWLMPDWRWEIIEIGESRWEMRLASPFGPISIKIATSAGSPLSPLPSPITKIQLVRAGELLYGSGIGEPFMGWIAPTYANKIPALALTVATTGTPPLDFVTEWHLPTRNGHAT